MRTDPATYWNQVYSTRSPDEVSWHQEDPARSLRLIRSLAPDPSIPIIDIGGGASRLAGMLLESGYGDLTVLDVAAEAMAHARERIGAGAERITWIEANAVTFRPSKRYRLWHDRAVFHFLTEPADRLGYLEALSAAVPSGGAVIIAAFAEDGPDRCSGLPVVRYSSADLTEALRGTCASVGFETELHVTPDGRPQHFLYGWFRRVGDPRSGGDT